MERSLINAALRDSFVCGLKSEATQKKLLTESDLTFTRAVEIALSMEAATTNTKQMHSSSTPSASVQKPAEVCKVKSSSQKKEASFRCYRCGNPDHRPSHCPSSKQNVTTAVALDTSDLSARNPRIHLKGKPGNLRGGVMWT